MQWSEAGETAPEKRSERMLSENRMLWDRYRKLKKKTKPTENQQADKECAARGTTHVIILASLI